MGGYRSGRKPIDHALDEPNVTKNLDKHTMVHDERTLTYQRWRKVRAEADIKELEKLQLQQKLIHIDDILPTIEEELSKVRAALLSLPRTLTQSLRSAPSHQHAQKIFEQEIAKILSYITCDGEGRSNANK